MQNNYTIESQIGQTNLHKLKNTQKNSIYIKCENNNPSGQFHDRIIASSLKLAKSKNLLEKKKILLDTCTGITTISLAIIGISKGFKIKAFFDENLDKEIYNFLKSLDVLLIEKKFYVKIEENKNLEIFDFRGFLKDNYRFLELGVVDEICRKVEKIDYLFITPETSIILNESNIKKLPETKIIQIFENKKIENDFITEYFKISEIDGIETIRNLLKQEALLFGKKSGKAISGALNFIKENDLEKEENLNFIIISEDSLENQKSLLNSKSLLNNEIINYSDLENEKSFFKNKKFSDFLEFFQPLPFFDKRLTIGDCYDLLQRGFCVIPLRESGNLIGVVDRKILLNEIMNKKTNKFFSSFECMEKEFLRLEFDVKISVIENLLEEDEYVLVVEKKLNNCVKNVFCVTRKSILGLLKNEMKEFL